jgi:hypothetical protein
MANRRAAPAWASRPPTNRAGKEFPGAGCHPAERGRRRTRQDQDFTSAEAARMKLRTEPRIRNERRKPVSSAAPASKGTNAVQSSVQPFDLMSRRHPLSSVGLSDGTRFSSKRIVFRAPTTRRHQAAGFFVRRRITSSSSRPCGSSSQSSSLRSSPS